MKDKEEEFIWLYYPSSQTDNIIMKWLLQENSIIFPDCWLKDTSG